MSTIIDDNTTNMAMEETLISPRFYTTNYKELTVLINEHNLKDEERFHKLKSEFSSRVGILEKWRWIIIGGSIVAGFILHKVIMFAI